MSKASCCCWLRASAVTGLDAMATIETNAARRANQKRVRDVRALRQISRTISLSNNADPRDRFRQLSCSFGKLSDNAVAADQPFYLASFTAMTWISTRNPGLASAATPTTDLAGRLG